MTQGRFLGKTVLAALNRVLALARRAELP